MLIHELTLKNFLSYGPDSRRIELRDLNVIIGANGSGKSNLLEAVALLQSAPTVLISPMREGGGSVHDWLWKGEEGSLSASVEIVAELPRRERTDLLRYRFVFSEINKRFEIKDERLEYSKSSVEGKDPYFFYKYENNHPILNLQPDPKKKQNLRTLRREEIDPERSILSQRRDPLQYPEITYLAEALSEIKVYRDWGFGRAAAARFPQSASLPNRYIEPDSSNLGLVLNRLRREGDTKQKIVKYLRDISQGVEDFEIDVEAGSVQVFLRETPFNKPIPSTRISDGTLRYLFLLAILCDPNPPPLICIDEPELGIHPDLIGNIAELLKEASNRTQLIVTTHSDILVDSFNEDPEAILVCEKDSGSTNLNRLNRKELDSWLKTYRLGHLWSSGHIGGNRW